jgi:hypothetical protein
VLQRTAAASDDGKTWSTRISAPGGNGSFGGIAIDRSASILLNAIAESAAGCTLLSAKLSLTPEQWKQDSVSFQLPCPTVIVDRTTGPLLDQSSDLG